MSFTMIDTPMSAASSTTLRVVSSPFVSSSPKIRMFSLCPYCSWRSISARAVPGFDLNSIWRRLWRGFLSSSIMVFFAVTTAAATDCTIIAVLLQGLVLWPWKSEYPWYEVSSSRSHIELHPHYSRFESLCQVQHPLHIKLPPLDLDPAVAFLRPLHRLKSQTYRR